MGFKAFNMAMVGKQAWTLVSSPESLITCLLKAKYYPQSDYFGARIGHNPSYVWRSIWSAKDVIRRGFQWSIGTGEHIPVWDHPWLNNHEFYRLLIIIWNGHLSRFLTCWLHPKNNEIWS